MVPFDYQEPSDDNIAKIVSIFNDLYQVLQTPEGPQSKGKGQLSSFVRQSSRQSRLLDLLN